MNTKKNKKTTSIIKGRKKNPPVQEGIKDPKLKVLTAMGWELTRT
jgi:hypothetical protein